MSYPSSREHADKTTDYNIALIMGEIASKPNQCTQFSLTQKINTNQSTVSRAIQNLEMRKWVARGTKVPRIGSGRTANVLFPTDEFHNAAIRASDAAVSLGSPLVKFYLDTVDAAKVGTAEDEFDINKLEARARFLGGVAVLGEHADLQVLTDGEWLSDQAGWHLLVTAQAVDEKSI
jgi:DNA-binding MarR family transcriptional regulator